MAGPRPDDNYNPTQTVTPSTSAPNDYLTTRANGNQFGAQVGEAYQRTGSDISDVGNKTMDVSLQSLGLANEHAANMADMQLAVDGGDVYNKYKSLEGLDASNAKNGAIQSYLGVNQKIRESLPNAAAQRAYDTIATRRMSFTIQDMNSYAATQKQKAYREGNEATSDLAVQQANSYGVASSNDQFNFEMSGIIHSLNANYTAPEYGKYQTIPATTDPKTGRLDFDTSTTDGKTAQADYDNYMNTKVGQAWANRVNTLVNDRDNGNVLTAMQVVKNNYDSIPPAARARILAILDGPYKAMQVKDGTNQIMSQADQDYKTSLSQSAPTTATPDVIRKVFADQESGSGKTSSNTYQIQPGTWSKFAHPGEVITNPQDNEAVFNRYMDYIQKLPKVQGDPARAAVAFFSGEGNLSPIGSKTPFLNDHADASGKSVSSYVQDIQNRIGSVTAGSGATGIFQSKADYLRSHYDDLIGQAGDNAERLHPNNAVFRDSYIARTTTQIHQEITAQEVQDRAHSDFILGKVFDAKHPVTSIDQLDYSGDPQIRDAWTQMQAQNPYGAQNIRNRVAVANSRGQATQYGTNYFQLWNKVVSGQITDPSELSSWIDPHSGNKSPLTNTGMNQLIETMKGSQTPEQASQNRMIQNFFNTLHNSKIGPSNPHGDEMFSNYMQSALPLIAGQHGLGKTDSQLFDPKSPDYVGKGLDVIYPPSKRLSDRKEQALGGINFSNLGGRGSPGPSQFSTSSLDSVKDATAGRSALQTALDSHQITAQQYTDYAKSRGWKKSSGPAIPEQ